MIGYGELSGVPESKPRNRFARLRWGVRVSQELHGGNTAGTKIDQIGTVSSFDCTISPTTGPLRRGTRVCGDPARIFGVHSEYFVGVTRLALMQCREGDRFPLLIEKLTSVCAYSTVVR